MLQLVTAKKEWHNPYKIVLSLILIKDLNHHKWIIKWRMSRSWESMVRLFLKLIGRLRKWDLVKKKYKAAAILLMNLS